MRQIFLAVGLGFADQAGMPLKIQWARRLGRRERNEDMNDLLAVDVPCLEMPPAIVWHRRHCCFQCFGEIRVFWVVQFPDQSAVVVINPDPQIVLTDEILGFFCQHLLLLIPVRSHLG